MGLGDAFKGLFSRREAPAQPFALLPREAEVARALGTWRAGTLASIDGHLLLTTQRLVFTSDADGVTAAVLVWALHGSPPAPGAWGAVGAVARHATDEQVPRVDGLAAVEIGADASLLAPPSLVLADSTGRRIEIGIVANRLTSNLSHANAVARDRMVATVRSAIASATAARQPRHRQRPEPDRFSWFPHDQ